ncbi:MAG: hypothetical protein F4089_02065 [Gammaproteobacteria bacterium]|nr:hypothetical protein [Gammaproteobacteria bacterium]
MLSRWMLEETAALLSGADRAALLEITGRTPLPKPADHKGGGDTDMFEIDLSHVIVRAIVEAVEDATSRCRRTPRSTKIGGFAAAWRELRDWQGRHV